jgi:hypothetical protein
VKVSASGRIISSTAPWRTSARPVAGHLHPRDLADSMIALAGDQTRRQEVGATHERRDEGIRRLV